jgi:hypothetical protein
VVAEPEDSTLLIPKPTVGHGHISLKILLNVILLSNFEPSNWISLSRLHCLYPLS